MKEYEFDSSIVIRGTFPSNYLTDTIKNEPMFFNSSLSFAYSNGGPITQKFIESLPKDWMDCGPVLDSRVHMLMPNMYPCIPGWHHDDVPRGGLNEQPYYSAMPYKSVHLMGLVNAEICPTVFALGKHKLPKVSEGVVYDVWNDLVEKQIGNELTLQEAKSGELIQFDWQSMHRGQMAKSSGWRWFVRISRNTDRVHRITNEIRKQVQVYLDKVNGGW